MLKVKNISEIYDMSVYTDDGTFFGSVEESLIVDNKVSGWKIKATRGSILGKMIGGAKGVIVPQQFVKAIDNIMIISKSAVPSPEEDSESPEQE